MTHEQHLKLLQCNQYSTIEEIKSSYRGLSKKYHPDMNKDADPRLFIQLTQSYQYLVKHHAPKFRLPGIENAEPFFFILENEPYKITMPEKVLTVDAVVYCILKDKEFRFVLKSGTELPTKIEISNIMKRPIQIHIAPIV